MTLTVYSKPNCPNCVILKDRLDQKSVDYTTIELDFGQTTQNELITVIDFKTKFPGITSMPFFVHEDGAGVVTTGGMMQALKKFA